MVDDVDFVSDLNGTGDTTVSVNSGDVSHVADNTNAQRTDGVKPLTKVAADLTPAQAAADKPKSLRDQISSALKGETNTPPVASQNGAVRNPDGTFAPKPVVDPTTVQAQAITDPALNAVRAPQGIDPEVFKALPAETQAQLARTMDDLGQRQQRIARLEPVEQLIAPRRDAWALNGMSEQQAIGQLLALSDFASRDMKGFIKYMADNNNISLEELVLTTEPLDPEKKALMDRISALETQHVQGTRQQQQAAHSQRVDFVMSFASEKGSDNQPLRPHFAELDQDILPQISAIKTRNPSWSDTQVLQEAYDRACWASPSVRNKMQATSNAVAEAERLRQGADRVTQARAAAVSIKPGTPTSAATPPNDSSRTLRDTIKASMAAAG